MLMLVPVLGLLAVAASVQGETRELVPSEAPGNLTLLEIRNRQVVIEWQPVSPDTVRGSFRGYLVRTWNHAGSQVYAFPSDVTRVNVEFFPFSKNFITVSARNEKYVGPPSEAVSFDAPQIEPNLPYILNVFPLSDKSVLLQWSKPTQPNGILLGYKIYCSIINDTLSFEEIETHQVSHEILDPDKFQAKLTGMEEGVKYRIGISAFNCAGESERKNADITLDHHDPAEPFPPKFVYKIDYKMADAVDLCSPENSPSWTPDAAPSTTPGRDFDYYDYLAMNETKKRQAKVAGGKPPREDDKSRCLVDCLVLWIPDVRNNPGEYFYVKYRVRGEAEFQRTEPEMSEDFIVLHDFDACKNYEMVLTAVDGEYSTDSAMLVTPTKIF